MLMNRIERIVYTQIGAEYQFQSQIEYILNWKLQISDF